MGLGGLTTRSHRTHQEVFRILKSKRGGLSDSGKHLGGEEGKFAVRGGGGAWPGEKLNKIQYSFAEK
jgi:hypothetical protein